MHALLHPKPLPRESAMSAERTAFETAVKKSDWAIAYRNFRILNMSEMCKGLHALGDSNREAFWKERQANLVYPAELSRWEYAYTVVRFHILPANPPNTAQESEAAGFLKSVVKRPPTRLEQNLGYSMQGVNYVLTQNKLKGANWDFYTPATKTESYEYYARKADIEKDPKEKQRLTNLRDSHRDSLDVCLYDRSRPASEQEVAAAEQSAGRKLNWLEEFRIKANRATQTGCGNCDEHSILAFMFLYDMQVRPLDRMYSGDRDHAFVVIGRKEGSDANDPKTWGDEACICDPWAQGLRYGKNGSGTYSATRFTAVMTGLLGKFTITDIHRVV